MQEKGYLLQGLFCFPEYDVCLLLMNMMEYIRISRKFSFEAAHALQNYDGACRHIHGHSYKLEVSLLGPVRQEWGHPKDGMVMDFGDLKKLVQTLVIGEWDHALLLHQKTKPALIDQLRKNGEKLVLLPYQPSCENMLLDIRSRLQQHLPPEISLRRLMLSETENSYAEWYAEDNTGSTAPAFVHAVSTN